jgi:membrane protein DedA with SNARE-associated domain
MSPTWFDTLLTWIGTHPHAAGAVVFAVAFLDALVVIGAVVPALPVLLPVGILIGMDKMSGPYMLVCAALGAFLGDGISFIIGRRWGRHLYDFWPFSKYPQLLQRGETHFRRNEVKSIIVARYAGPIRAFVPAVAGMSRMPLKRYVPASLFAAVSWAAVFLAPGWVLGQAYDTVAAVAGRLALVLGLLALVLLLAWLVVLFTYRWFATHADALLARALRWSHAHPMLGLYSEALFDPKRRESVSLALLALLLLIIGWACFAFLVMVIGHGKPLALDLAVNQLMQGVRNPLADYPLAALAALGDLQVLATTALAALLYLLWRKRWLAAAHWVAAIAFGLALTAWLGAVVDIPKPPAVSNGFGFPSVAVTMATIIFGFFAVLIARELPGRKRLWPYMIASLAVSLIGFARLYLGAHWLSDVVGGVLLGVAWLLALGVAYRRRVDRPFWMKPLAWVFYGTFTVAALWHAPRSVDAMLARFEIQPVVQSLAFDDWWNVGWQQLPARRNEFDNEQRWPLDVQVAGSLQSLQRQLETAGWRAQPQAGWQEALQLLNIKLLPDQQPVLPATLDTHAESLLMLRPGANPGEMYALRLWQAPAQLRQNGNEIPLWIGSAQVLRHHEALRLVDMWLPMTEADAALAAVTEAVSGLPQATDIHPDSTLPVLRVRVE